MLKIFHYKDLGAADKKRILTRASIHDPGALQIAEKIIGDVEKHGEEAVIAYTRQFDGVEIALSVSPEEFAAADQLSKEQKQAFELAAENIKTFHRAQKSAMLPAELTIAGTVVGFRYAPVPSAAIYVPGGKARYPSTVLMGLIPAEIAGVSNCTIITPPGPDGRIDPSVLFCARLGNCKRIIKHGGAQGVATAAFGLGFPATSLIVGPGNRFVTAAKQILSARGLIRQDQPAGPSEVVVIADETANPEYVAADMLSQAEHGADSPALLLTTSERIAQETSLALARALHLRPERAELKATSIREHSCAIVFNEIKAAIAFSNEYAPEHLEICTAHPEKDFTRISAAGSVFLGHYAPVALGDYYSGTNHILPTGGAARSTSGLGVDTFLKRITYQHPTRESLQKALEPVMIMSRLEGLEHEHGNSVAIRLKKDES